MSMHTTCGMNAHLYHIVGLSMLDAEDRYGFYGCGMYEHASVYETEAAVI